MDSPTSNKENKPQRPPRVRTGCTKATILSDAELLQQTRDPQLTSLNSQGIPKAQQAVSTTPRPRDTKAHCADSATSYYRTAEPAVGAQLSSNGSLGVALSQQLPMQPPEQAAQDVRLMRGGKDAAEGTAGVAAASQAPWQALLPEWNQQLHTEVRTGFKSFQEVTSVARQKACNMHMGNSVCAAVPLADITPTTHAKLTAKCPSMDAQALQIMRSQKAAEQLSDVLTSARELYNKGRFAEECHAVLERKLEKLGTADVHEAAQLSQRCLAGALARKEALLKMLKQAAATLDRKMVLMAADAQHSSEKADIADGLLQLSEARRFDLQAGMREREEEILRLTLQVKVLQQEQLAVQQHEQTSDTGCFLVPTAASAPSEESHFSTAAWLQLLMGRG